MDELHESSLGEEVSRSQVRTEVEDARLIFETAWRHIEDSVGACYVGSVWGVEDGECLGGWGLFVEVPTWPRQYGGVC
jgi:hypothetical protein